MQLRWAARSIVSCCFDVEELQAYRCHGRGGSSFGEKVRAHHLPAVCFCNTLNMYQMRDYLAASAIVAGLFIFQQDSAKSGSSTLFGISVLLLSLTFDSLNSNYNEKVVSVNRCNRLRLQCHSIAASCMCRCDVLRVFAQTNFIACIMSAVCVIVSGVQSPRRMCTL